MREVSWRSHDGGRDCNPLYFRHRDYPSDFFASAKKPPPFSSRTSHGEVRPARANPPDSSPALPEPAKRVSGAFLTRGAARSNGRSLGRGHSLLAHSITSISPHPLAPSDGFDFSLSLAPSDCFGCSRHKAGRSYAVAQPVRSLLVGLKPSLRELDSGDSSPED